MLAFITRNHVDGLLDQVEIILLVAACGREIKISIYKGLGTSIEKGVDIGLIPATLFDRLKLAVEIIKPLPNIALRRL
jgi:hypothetical protein